MKYRVEEVCQVNSENLKQSNEYKFINYLDTANITEGKIDEVKRLIIGEDKIPSRAKRKVKKDDIVISTVRPNLKHYGIIKNPLENMIVSTGFAVLSPNKKIVDPDYLYYYLTQQKITDYLSAIAETSTSAYPSITANVIKKIEVDLPSRSEQSKIAETLSVMDEKIELNNEINKTLEEIAQSIFKHWFIDFEFPNENGEPYKSSGGKLVESELGMIPEAWSYGKLKDISINHDSKRIPLSKRERDKREKIYPYYGAASLMDYVDDYLFDGTYLLIGEDGTVIDEKGHPILQYVWGKFWVNNHAHVLQGKDKISTEYLYLLLSRTNVSHIITGAVQKKINQRNLNSIDVIIPKDQVLDSFHHFITPIFSKIKMLSNENNTLSNTRDTLLPKLMSGEIRIPEAEQEVEACLQKTN